MIEDCFANRIVLRRRGVVESLAISLALVAAFSLLRWVSDGGALGVQFAGCFPAILVAAVLLRRGYVVLVAFGSVASAQWLLVGERWFNPLDLPHVLIALLFLLALAIIMVIGTSLRAALYRLEGLLRQQSILNQELRSRTNNILDLVQSLASSTSVEQPPHEFFSDFSSRLAALSGANAMLKLDASDQRRLPEMVETCLAPFDGDKRIECSGPQCMLSREGAIALMLVLHELATGSLRIGALSVLGGKVEVDWSVESKRRLRFRWREAGGPDATFTGDRRYRGALLREHEGMASIELDCRREGLACEIMLEDVSTLEPAA